MPDHGPEVRHIGHLTPDPQNARRHTARNVGMIEAALREVGAGRSIVIDEDGVVLAGNATIEAAAQAGIERVQVVDVDGETIVAVRRTGLTAAQKARLALYDNRAAELAEWDTDVLRDMEQQVDLGGLWHSWELDSITGTAPDVSEPEPRDHDDEREDTTVAPDGNTAVRQIVLTMDSDRYARLTDLMDDLMERDGAETWVDVVEAALRHHWDAGPDA